MPEDVLFKRAEAGGLTLLQPGPPKGSGAGLAPQTSTATGPFGTQASQSSAASAQAPAGSTSSRASCHRTRRAATMASSGTVTLSTPRAASSKQIDPIRRAPSAFAATPET